MILGKGPTDGLDDTTLTAEAEYSINFTEQQKELCLSLHYNGSNSFFFVNGGNVYQLKAKDSELNTYPLCLVSISNEFTADDMRKLDYMDVFDFLVVYDSTDVSDFYIFINI